MSKREKQISLVVVVLCAASLVGILASWKWAGVFLIGWILIVNALSLFRKTIK